MKFIWIYFFLFLFSCTSKNEEFTSQIEILVKQQKYQIAFDKISKRFQSQRAGDEILSSHIPKKQRIVNFSIDRNRLVWLEDKRLIFRDLANPLIKTKKFIRQPRDFSISADASYAIVIFPAQKNGRCLLRSVSLVDFKPDYNIASSVSCQDRPYVTTDGGVIYYFSNGELFKEVTIKYNKPILLAGKDKFHAPYPKINNKQLIYPLGKTFIVFSGNAGDYNLYWFNPMNQEIKLLSKKMVLPVLYYGDGKQGYLIGGSIGKLYMQQISFPALAAPKLSKKHAISMQQTRLWKKLQAGEFFVGSNQVYSWKIGQQLRPLPLLCRRFWGVARNELIYESNRGELILSKAIFPKGEKQLLEIYLNLQEKLAEAEEDS